MNKNLKLDKILLHSFIGLAIIAAFWFIPPVDPITNIGMRCLGIFLGMIYLWSMVDVCWPSLLGLVLIGCSGYANLGTVLTEAIGHSVVIQCIFILILFGALDYYGCSQYIAKWFLTRKVFQNRPYIFIAMFYLAAWALSLISAIMALLLLWPIAVKIVENLGINKTDTIWKYFFIGMYLIVTIGQITLPFYGQPLMFIGTLQTMSNGAYIIDSLGWIIYEIIMVSLVLILYLLILKLLVRPDVSKLKAVDPAKIEAEFALPPMNLQQKVYLIMIPIYLTVLLLPLAIPKTVPGIQLLSDLGATGFALIAVGVLSILPYQDSRMLTFEAVASKKMNWGLIFLIAAAVYAAGTISNESNGIIPFITGILTPILSNCSETMFVFLMLIIILIITNFANNAAMVMVLMPIILSFAPNYGISPIPIILIISSLAFVAILTPSASPHSSMLWGMKSIYDSKDILKVGFPIVFGMLILNLLVGYPLAKIIF